MDARSGAPLSSGDWWRQPLPAWAHAAAACLLFAAGLWLGVVRGSAPGASPGVPLLDVAASGGEPAVAIGAASANVASARGASTSATSALVSAASRADLEALEHRLGAELTQLRAERDSALTAAPSGRAEAQMLARVRALIEESEQRQQRELALRTAQVVREFDSQRQVDLAQIQRNFGQIEGLTGAEVREQRQMLNYLMRVSEQP